VSARPAVVLALSDVDAPAVPGAASATDDVADAFFGGDAGGSEADAPVDEPSPAASVGYLSGRGLCLADLVLSQPLPSPAASVGYLSSRGFCLADLVLSQPLPSPAASAFFGGDAGGSKGDAPVDAPSPAASVGYLTGRGFCPADLVLSQPLPSPAASVGYLSSRGFCLADLVLSQPLPSRQSVASVRVCYLSCHVFALADGHSPAVVVVPDSRRCANVSCA
jgi:hypothetical protein